MSANTISDILEIRLYFFVVELALLGDVTVVPEKISNRHFVSWALLSCVLKGSPV